MIIYKKYDNKKKKIIHNFLMRKIFSMLFLNIIILNLKNEWL